MRRCLTGTLAELCGSPRKDTFGIQALGHKDSVNIVLLHQLYITLLLQACIMSTTLRSLRSSVLLGLCRMVGHGESAYPFSWIHPKIFMLSKLHANDC